eukprot:TRINITY_DN14298_c0_g1_i1.p1 TRINITY_DN14298_c0_g1~~TRINITY_DN14298_c0_g1_i1.p1  ORF type:complete len:615 (-),score=58.31 TRINITY_DN14298_c0_g1_i1:15-1859(-)
MENDGVINGDKIQAHRLLNLGIKQYDLNSALETFTKAVTMDSDNAEILKWLGNTKRMLYQSHGALADFDRADELSPNDPFTLSRRAEVKRVLKDFRGAIEDFDKADRLQPNDAWILRNRGAAKTDVKDLIGALEDLNKADQLEPNNGIALRRRGDVKRLMKDYEGALEDLNRSDELQPNVSFTLGRRVETKRMLGDYEGALDDFNKAEELKPNDPLVLAGRGAIRRKFGDLEGSLNDLNRSDELEPCNSYTRAERGYTKRLYGDFAGALQDLDIANELEPDDPTTLASRGATKRMFSNFTEAIEDLNRADELKPNDPFTIVNRALVYYAMNRMHDAFVDFSLYDELVPNNNDYPAHKNKVEDRLLRGIPFNQLKIIKALGEGGFGQVHLATWKGKYVALKRPRGFDSSCVLLEAVTIMKFRHENIVASLGFCYAKKGDISLVMEYAKNGSLYDLLYVQKAKLTRGTILSYAHDIASGLAYLHGRNVIHRDLKSANILLFDGKTRAKIADFGQSRFLRNQSIAKTIVGTPFFMAPEVLSEESYDNSADVYSFGVLLYEMCTNTILPIIGDEIARMNKIRTTVLDTEYQKLIMKCCQTDAKQRPSIQQCLDILNKI